MQSYEKPLDAFFFQIHSNGILEEKRMNIPMAGDSQIQGFKEVQLFEDKVMRYPESIPQKVCVHFHIENDFLTNSTGQLEFID